MNCDPLARWYRWLECLTLGRSLERRRFEFLPQMVGAQTVLILGEGDGRFLRRFLERNPDAQVDCVDSSAKMLAVAQERMDRQSDKTSGTRGHIVFRHADARLWTPAMGCTYDLVVTHFFLDCFSQTDADALIRRYGTSVRTGGSWIVSEFRVPEAGWKCWRAKLCIGALYRLFGWFTGLKVRHLPEHRAPLETAGFRLVREVTSEAGMLVSEWWTKEPTDALNGSETMRVTG